MPGGRSASSWPGAGELGDVLHIPIVPQLPAGTAAFSTADLFVCSSPERSLGSRQIKSQLAHSGHGGQCGMCSWQAALIPWQQRSLAAALHPSREGPWGTCCSHTALSIPAALAGSHRRTSHSTRASGLHLTRERLWGCSQRACVEYSSFLELSSNMQHKGAAAVIASDNRCCSSSLKYLENIHGRGFVPVLLPGETTPAKG